MDGAPPRSMVPARVLRGFLGRLVCVALVFGDVPHARGDNARKCKDEAACHFGAAANLVLNLTEPVSPDDPAARALARFSVVPHGCAHYFAEYVAARDKLPAAMRDHAGASESLCDSKRVFAGPDMAVAVAVVVANAVTIVVLGCTVGS